MKLVLGSDLHGYLPKVPSGDVLVLAGDILPEKEQDNFIQNRLRPWLVKAPVGNVVAIWGNHDDQPFRYNCHNINLPWILLIDQSVLIDGIKFHGTPWCLPIGRWAWQAPEYILEKVYDMIPEDTDILISHSPPYMIRDKTDIHPIKLKPSENAGSRALRERMNKLPNLKLLVCGHIHEARGQEGRVVNVSCLDLFYKPYPNPWAIVEI